MPDSRAALWVLGDDLSQIAPQAFRRPTSDVFTRRVSVSTPAKLTILAQGAVMALRNRVALVNGREHNDVIVVGAGAAGLAAAAALAGAGKQVTVA